MLVYVARESGGMEAAMAFSDYDTYEKPDEDYDDFDYDDFEDGDLGQHCGVLAGLSFDEREQAIEEHMATEDELLASKLVDLLDYECSEGPIARGMADLLSKETLNDVRRFAKYMGLEGAHDLDEELLIGEIVAHVEDEDAIGDIVAQLSEHHMNALRDLAERGGIWTIDADDIVSLRNLPNHEVGLSYVFHEKGQFTFVMPDEAIDVVRSLDWDTMLSQAAQYRQLVDFVNNLTELVGIVSMWDVIWEYRRCYPDGYQTEHEIVMAMVQAVGDQIADFNILENEAREMYVLHYELFWAYEEEMDITENPFFIEPITHGELGDMLKALMIQQREHDPHPLTPEMLEERNLYMWKLRQEPVWALTQYLDSHVPDVADDYYFADRAVEGLVGDAKWGLPDDGAQRFFDILEANDFVPGADQIQDLLDLWSDVVAALPTWPNNGWAPIELAALSDEY